MRNWKDFVRDNYTGRSLSDQAVEELAQHVEETWRAALARGDSEEDALELARAELRNPPRRIPPAMHAPPSTGAAGLLSSIARDLRYAVRMLRARPGFAAVAVITLALGIGANTAIFSIVRTLLFKPLAFRDPGRLVLMWEADAEDLQRTSIVSMPNYEDFSHGVTAFDGSGIFELLVFNVSGGVQGERVPAARLSASTFHVLGVDPALGRTFTQEEDAPDHHVVIISHALWQRRFGGRGDVIGSTTRVNGTPHEIVGVMPAGFTFPTRDTAVWTPIAFNDEDRHRGSHSFLAIARLRPEVTLAAANAELDSFARNLAKQHPDSNAGDTAVLTPMGDFGIAPLRSTFVALSGAVVLVLLIACVNVANLLLVQAGARRQEFAVRIALGASRWRLARQLLVEATLIASIGGAAGLAVAWGGTHLLGGLLPNDIVSPPFRDTTNVFAIDRGILAFTAGVALVTGGLFGLAPVVGMSRGADVRGGTRSVTGRTSAVRTTLVAAEVALALVVLVAAGLMVKSLVRVLDNKPGLDPTNVLLLGMALPQMDFYGPPVRQTFCDEITSRVTTLPGVVAAGAISHLPLSGSTAGRSFAVEGLTMPPGQTGSAAYRVSCPGYFKALGIPIVKGRDFDARDTTTAVPVVIVNEETVKRYWPDQDPIGRRLRMGPTGPWITVIGVARNVRHFGLDSDARREMFRPYSQAAWPVMIVVAKTAAEPPLFVASIRDALQHIDPDLPVGRVSTMEEVAVSSTGDRRFPMILLAAFGGVALLLAMVGVYGVVSAVVTQRTREIGIRVALGARSGEVIRLVVSGAMRPVIAGLVLGGIGAVFASRLLGTLLYQVKPGDPAVLAAIAGLLAAAGVVAALVPGVRATRVDPVTVLRAE